MKGGFLIVKLLERREPRTLDLEADEAEIRRRYWSAYRNELLRQRRDERLLGSGFKLREAPTGAPANDPAATPHG
jgi:parvulin-like peptidyl-prolyl isomerase